MGREYAVGPTLAPEERPWPLGWESDPVVAECPHFDWETVLLAADGLHRTRVEEVVRCAECHAPRCGNSIDADPCVLVRHHDGDHFLVSQYPPIPSFHEDRVAHHFGWVPGVPACIESPCPAHGWRLPNVAPLSSTQNPKEEE